MKKILNKSTFTDDNLLLQTLNGVRSIYTTKEGEIKIKPYGIPDSLMVKLIKLKSVSLKSKI
jgi:hypothetical protein